MKQPRKKTRSDYARELHAQFPRWSLAEVGRCCGLTGSGVQKALGARYPGKRGRPRLTKAEKLARLKREIADVQRLRDAS